MMDHISERWYYEKQSGAKGDWIVCWFMVDAQFYILNITNPIYET